MVKIVVVGPERAGKTTIANSLAGISSQSSNTEENESFENLPCRGTVGTRILEFDIKLTSQQAKKWNGNRSIEIEMWDCSGNIAYESCWPAIQADSVGVVLVYNPENATSSNEVVSWYEWFVSKAGLSHEQCLVLANDRNSGQGDPRAAPPRDIEESEIIYTDADSSEKIRQAFTDFIGVIGKYRK